MQNRRYCFIRIVMQWQIRKSYLLFFSQWESGQSTDIAFGFSSYYGRSGKDNCWIQRPSLQNSNYGQS